MPEGKVLKNKYPGLKRSASGYTADMILYNGKIITVDSHFNIVQAIAIRDGKFLVVGNDADVKALAGPDTVMIDLDGNTVTPGIIDSHTHPVGVGSNLLAHVQMSDVDSLKDVFDRLRKAQNEANPDQWIITARNWYVGQIERRPNLSELDTAVPNNPLWLPLGAHEGFTNTRGIQLAGITKDTPDPPGGAIYKDPSTGKPTGHLRSTAMKMVMDLLPPMDPMAGLRAGIRYYNSLGVTAIGNDGVGMKELMEGEYKAFQKLRLSGELSLRSVLTLMIDPSVSKEKIFGMIHAIAYSGMERGGLGDDLLKVVGLKTINENTATGEILWPRDSLRDVLLEAAKNELRFTIHSVCAGNEETLGLYQEVNQHYPIRHLRWAVVHQHFQEETLMKINQELGLVMNHELGFAFIGTGPEVWYGKLFGAPKYPHRLIAPIPLYIKAGIPFSLNSDGGGANNQCSIWVSFYVACNREKWPGWGDEYSISREDALKAISLWGAYKLGMEDRIGSIEVGKLADLAVLSEDPLTCDPEKISDISAKITVIGGQIVYRVDD
jgi:predicted amidohydrolase YtcJ